MTGIRTIGHLKKMDVFSRTVHHSVSSTLPNKKWTRFTYSTINLRKRNGGSVQKIKNFGKSFGLNRISWKCGSLPPKIHPHDWIGNREARSDPQNSVFFLFSAFSFLDAKLLLRIMKNMMADQDQPRFRFVSCAPLISCAPPIFGPFPFRSVRVPF